MTEPALTVTECLNALNNVLHTQVLIVEGEINSYNVSQNRWVFFTLRDEQSKLECFAVLYKIGTPLEPGMTVRVIGIPGIHKRSGKFTLTIDKLEVVGEGALQKAYELLKLKLEREGLFSDERKRTITKFPQHVALVASDTSAAYSDFLKVLNNRWQGISVDVINTAVQGEKAVEEITQAFETLNESSVQYDVVVLTRGGGSLEDLHAFNDERVVRSVARSRVPVICAVGHERDVTIADLAADIRASTPSNAAEILVPDKTHEKLYISNLEKRIVSISKNLVLNQQHNIKYLAKVLFSEFDRQSDTIGKMSNRVQSYLTHTQVQITDEIRTVSSEAHQILRVSKMRFLDENKTLSNLVDKARLQNPNNLLKRGYSIVRSGGNLVRKVSDAKLNDPLQITVSDGKIDAVISRK
jgi:exodeoxyribonuclease VII large subunit